MGYTRELIWQRKLIKESKLGARGDLELLGLALYCKDYLSRTWAQINVKTS